MARLLYRVFSNDEEVKGEMNRNSSPGEENCYYDYPYRYVDGELFYFGFYAHPNILKLIEEINNQFTNIKVVVVDFIEKMKVITGGGFFYKDIGNRLYPYKMVFPEHYSYCLFRVEFNSEYSSEARFILNLLFAEFLRGYCPEYMHFIKAEEIKDNFIDNMIDAQNTTSYGAWMCSGNYKTYCERNTFNSLDNIKFVNSVSESWPHYNNEDNDEYDEDYDEDLPLISSFIYKLEEGLVNE